MFKEYDVIVVGAGHAGCEAASAAASMGSTVLSGDHEYEHHRSNVMQSRNGRSRERSNCKRNRRSGGLLRE